LVYGDRRRLAKALNVSDRLLRYLAEQKTPPKVGRPPHGPKVRWAALMGAGRELQKQGWTTGWVAVSTALPQTPVGLLKVFVPALKKRHRARVAKWRARNRVTLVVTQPGVLTTQDGFQAAGTKDHPVMAEVMRDAATGRYVGTQVGGSTTAEAVCAGLDVLGATAGYPLVYGTDNGPYQAPLVQAYLTAHEIVWYPSRRHTPQDNGAMERAIRELKAETGGLEDLPQCEIAERLATTTGRLNAHRIRPSRGGWTADGLTGQVPVCDPDIRHRFFETARTAIASAVAGVPPRQARAAWREAVVSTLEAFELARRWRGEGQQAPQEAEELM